MKENCYEEDLMLYAANQSVLVQLDIRQELKERFIELIHEMVDSGLIEGVGDIERVKDKIMEL